MVDSETGLATTRLASANADDQMTLECPERMHAARACVASFSLFLMSSFLLLHLFIILPSTSPAEGERKRVADKPSTLDTHGMDSLSSFTEHGVPFQRNLVPSLSSLNRPTTVGAGSELPSPTGGGEQSDETFEDLSATLLMLWLMMRLLALVAPTYVVTRFMAGRRWSRTGRWRRQEAGPVGEGPSAAVQLDVIVHARGTVEEAT